MSSQHKDGSGGGLIYIVAALGLFLLSLIGYIAAVHRASYRLVKFLLIPVSFLVAEFMGGVLFLCGGLFVAMCLRSSPMGNFITSHVSDYVLLGFLFGENTTEIWQIILFQLVLWMFIGHRLSRHLAFSIYDRAIQSIGNREGVHPYYVRESIRQSDAGYAEAERYYAKSGKPPLLGLMLVALSPTPVSEYY